MNEMTFKELFEIGETFESSVGSGTKDEIARIPKNNSRIKFTEENITFIQNIDKKVNILISGEIWCPDYQINGLIAKRFMEINPLIDISVVTLGRGRKYISKLMNADKEDFKAPTIAFLDENFELKGMFYERPKKVLESDFEEIKLDYYKGHYINETINDFCEILKTY
ncbi:MAG: thioredoxin family protein [Peptostreptococcaceae bacterium]